MSTKEERIKGISWKRREGDRELRKEGRWG